MTGLDSTSFDRFARYSYLRQVRASLPAAPLRVLDVGDPYGTLSAVLPDDDTVSLDLFHEGWPNVGRNSHVQASGFQLPFAEGTFDLVASHDVVEHLPAGSVEVFVAELLRVSCGPVVVVAPFDDPRTAQCESIVRGYYRARAGRPLEPLEEHAEGAGLPDAAQLGAWLDGRGLPWQCYAGGWLYHWLAMMLLKAHFAANGDIVADRCFDAAFIEHLTEADEQGPHYRRAFVIGSVGQLERPVAPPTEPAHEIERQRLDLSDVAWMLSGAMEGSQSPLAARSGLRRLLAEGGALERRAPALAASLRVLVGAILAAVPPAEERPPVTVVVAAMSGVSLDACLAELLPQLEACGGEAVIVVGDAADGTAGVAEGPSVRVVVEPAEDFILRANRGVGAAEGRAVLLLDPGLAIPPTLLADLLEAYRPEAGVTCVAARLAGRRVSPVRAALHAIDGPLGAEVLYAPREAMLVGRDHYSGLGGLDGAMRGVLDDVELGMRMRRRGERIRVAGGVCRWRQAPPPWLPAASDAEAAAVLRILFVTSPDSELWARLGPETVRATSRFPAAQRTLQVLSAASAIDVDPGGSGDAAELDPAARDLAARRAYVCSGFTVDGVLDLPFGGLHLSHLDAPASDQDGGTAPPSAPAILVVADSPRMLAIAGALRSVGAHRVALETGERAGKSLRQAGPAVVVASEASYVRDRVAFEAVPYLVLDTSSDHVDRSGPLHAADALICATSAQRDGLLASPTCQIPVATVACAPERDDLVAAHEARSHRRIATSGAVVLDGRGAPLDGGIVALGAALVDRLQGAAAVQILSDGTPTETGTGVRITTDPMILASASVVVMAPSSGGSALEALGWGVPVVTGSDDPAAGLVGAFDAGFVVGSEAALLEAVERLVSNPVLLAKAGASAALLQAESRQASAAQLRQLPGLAGLGAAG